MINVALDGPSGAGKSTLAKAVAAAHGFIYVDTGALYRSIGLYALRAGIPLESITDIVPLLGDIELSLGYVEGTQRVYLNGEDVSGLIRTPEISMYASAVSAQGAVREFLLDVQRDIAAKNNVIMDGRDIGTVILPNADVKIFVTADARERAMRRYKELCEKGETVTFDEVYRDMVKRDKNDATREIAPAIPASDAIEFDTSGIPLEECVKRVIKIIDDKTSK